MTRLNQILAVEPGVRQRAHQVKTALHKATTKAPLMHGFLKHYTPLAEDGQAFPDESQLVQYDAEGSFAALRGVLEPLLDLTAEKDWANCSASAAVEVDGQTVLEAVPPTYLLFLQKQLTDVRTFVEKMATLNPGVAWEREAESGYFRSPPERAVRTQKDQVPVLLHPPTTEHPAQTELVTKDVPIGYWDTVKLSGALPLQRQRQLLERVDALLRAVTFALEQANQQEIQPKDVGRTLLDFVFRE